MALVRALKVAFSMIKRHKGTINGTKERYSNDSTAQCDQKKLPNVYKSCPKMITLEK